MRHISRFVAVVLCALLATGAASAKPTHRKAVKKQRAKHETMAQAEARISKLITPDLGEDIPDKAHSELLKVIRKNPAGAMAYDFKKLTSRDDRFLSITTSPDRKLRFYYWDTGMGGTVPRYYGWFQYKKPGGQYDIQPMHSDDADETECADVPEIKGQLTGNDGSTLYLISDWLRGDSQRGIYSARVERITNKGLVEGAQFVGKDEKANDNVTAEICDIANWFFRTGGDADNNGWDWPMGYDPKLKELFVPISGTIGNDAIEEQQTDRYDVYRYDGKNFVWNRTDGGFWLHPSVRQFKHLVATGVVGTHRVRIDMMDDGTYRYAAWDNKAPLSQKPSVIINNGRLSRDEMCVCTFVSGNNTYAVTLNGDWRIEALEVLKNGKTVLKEQSAH